MILDWPKSTNHKSQNLINIFPLSQISVWLLCHDDNAADIFKNR